MPKKAAQVQSLKPSQWIAILEPLALLMTIAGCVLMATSIRFSEDGFFQLADEQEENVDPTFQKDGALILYYLPFIAIPFAIVQTITSNKKWLMIFGGMDLIWIILVALPLNDVLSNQEETNSRLDTLCPDGKSASGVIQTGCNNVSQAQSMALSGALIYLVAQIALLAATALEIKHVVSHPRLKDYDGWALRPKPAKPQARAMLTKSVQMPKDSSPLHQAAAFGDADAISDAIKADFELNGQLASTGDTPLHLASVANQIPAVKMLLKGGANVNATNKHGTTPLHIAGHYGNIPLCKILLKAGADITMQNAGGRTPIDSAEAGEQAAAVKFLKKHKK